MLTFFRFLRKQLSLAFMEIESHPLKVSLLIHHSVYITSVLNDCGHISLARRLRRLDLLIKYALFGAVNKSFVLLGG